MSLYKAKTEVTYAEIKYVPGDTFEVKDADASMFGWDKENSTVEKVETPEPTPEPVVPEAVPQETQTEPATPADAPSTDPAATPEPTPKAAPETPEAGAGEGEQI